MLLNSIPVRLQSFDAMLRKAMTRIADQIGGHEKIENHHRLEYIQLKLSVHSSDGNCHIITDHLCHRHRQCFTLSSIDFDEHDITSGFIGRNIVLTDSAS